MRRLTVEVMRRLDAAGIDCFLPDLPGCNESLQPLEAPDARRLARPPWPPRRSISARRMSSASAAARCSLPDLPGWRYAPVNGAHAAAADAPRAHHGRARGRA